MLWLIGLVLAACGWPWLLVGMVAAVVLWLVIAAGIGIAYASPDFQLGLTLLAVIVGSLAGVAWLLRNLFRVDAPVVARERREPHV
jgi:hypothetical protein